MPLRFIAILISQVAVAINWLTMQLFGVYYTPSQIRNLSPLRNLEEVIRADLNKD